MEFTRFSGTFGVYEGTAPVVTVSAGFADKNFAVANDPAFSYQTASGSKGFTAAAMLTLAAAGKPGLDAGVKEILLKAAGHEKYGNLEWLSDTVTVRMLLSHTSGIPDYFDEDITDDFEQALNGNAVYHYERPEHFFPLAAEVWREQETPYASQGTFRYSNGGFVVLAAAAEAAAHEPFPVLAAKYVFDPFGMTGSGFFRMDAPAPAGIVRATSYMKNGRSNIYAVPVIGGGDGGAYTNPPDMARFWTGLDPDTNPGSPMADIVAEAWAPQNEAEDGYYGLGFWISKKDPKIVFLEGFDPGVRFFSFYNRGTKRSLTVCLNDESMSCDEVFERYYAYIG